jgi:chorismate mutase
MRERLEARIAGLSQEIRSYPTPIARCDEQLTQLLDERAALVSRLREIEERGGCTPLSLWIDDGGFHAA